MDQLSLKWGTFKSCSITSKEGQAAFSRYREAGEQSLSAMLQRDTPEQKAALCELIDAIDNPVVYLDWDGEYVSKEDAKKYVNEYGSK